MNKLVVGVLLIYLGVFSGSLVLGTEGFFELVKAGNPEEVRRAIEAGADGKVRDIYGETAFDYAKDNEHLKGTDVYRLLNEARSDPGFCSKSTVPRRRQHLCWEDIRTCNM